jgi:hypothetical protein
VNRKKQLQEESDKRRDMRVLWIFVLVQTSNFYTTSAEDKVVSARKCCNNQLNLLHNNLCVPDKEGKKLRIDLTCKEKYVLDPATFEEESYNVTSAGELHANDLEGTISSDE